MDSGKKYGSFNELAADQGGGGVADMFVFNMGAIDKVDGYLICIPEGNEHPPPHITVKAGGRTLGKLPINPNDESSLTYDVAHIPGGVLKKIKSRLKNETVQSMYRAKWDEFMNKRGGNATQ